MECCCEYLLGCEGIIYKCYCCDHMMCNSHMLRGSFDFSDVLYLYPICHDCIIKNRTVQNVDGVLTTCKKVICGSDMTKLMLRY
jgi:hypothetical protein